MKTQPDQSARRIRNPRGNGAGLSVAADSFCDRRESRIRIDSLNPIETAFCFAFAACVAVVAAHGHVELALACGTLHDALESFLAVIVLHLANEFALDQGNILIGKMNGETFEIPESPATKSTPVKFNFDQLYKEVNLVKA